MNTILIAANITSVFYILIIAVGLLQGPKSALRSSRFFGGCIWLSIGGLIAETGICFFEGKPEYSILLLILNYLATAILDVIVIVYSFYLNDLISESRKNFKKIISYIVTILCIIDFVFNTVGIITGKLIDIIDGYVVPGPLDRFFGLIPALCFLLMVILYIVRFKDFRIKSPVFIVLIVLVPAVATVFLKLSSSVRYGYAGTALSLAVVYVVIQNRIIAETHASAMMYSNISITDQLTGLRNRRGYTEIIDGLSKEAPVGVAFVDINSLKAVNDKLGHKAGDELIIRVADILKKTVKLGTACRISGDEFVCIAENVDREDFEYCMTRLKSEVYYNDRIAAVGHDIGMGCDFKEIVKSAEKMMYQDKERYYRETGKDRRK